MLVKLLTGRVGPAGAADPGDILDIPDHEAETLVARGQAELVERPQVETAALHTVPFKGVRDGGITNTQRNSRGNRGNG